MATICKLCGGRRSDVGDRGCPHMGAPKTKFKDSLEHLSVCVDQRWRSERVERRDGEIAYEAHGPRSSFVRFEGPNAIADCAIFMNAVTNPRTR